MNLDESPRRTEALAETPQCTCPYTDESMWLSAASCGYGSGYEPGSMQEFDPDCPRHGGEPVYYWCHECDLQQPVDDEFETDNGDVDPRTFHIIMLECGHSIDWVVPTAPHGPFGA